MAQFSANLSTANQQLLTAKAAAAVSVNLLAPSGAIKAAVGDILAAAAPVAKFVNTANAKLASLVSAINDPISISFSAGQPYGGTFITSSVVDQLTPVDFNVSLNVSTQAVALLSAQQLLALSLRIADIQSLQLSLNASISVGGGISISTDLNLAAALAVVFSGVQINLRLGFSVDIGVSTNISPLAAGVQISALTGISIAPLTVNPDINALANFVSYVSPSFPNIPGIAGVAASIWVDNLGAATNVSGATVVGIPKGITTGSYTDITGATSNYAVQPSVNIVNFSQEQNKFNLVVALAIDHGLTTTLTQLMGASPVTPNTTLVVKTRLDSVAQRGDAAMLYTMLSLLTATDIPYPQEHIITLLTNLNPSDQPNVSTTPPPVTASGMPIETVSNPLTTSQLITYINSILVLTGITAAQLFSRNTCTGVLCSLPLLNVGLIKRTNKIIAETLLSTTTVEMANMF
jgi:hypothetical protein